MRRWGAELAALAAAAGVAVLLMFLLWEVVEHRFSDREAINTIHYARGISSSLVAALVVAFVSLRQSQKRARKLRGAIERSTGEAQLAREALQVVVDAAPAAFLLIDDQRRVVQANRLAERLHGSDLAGKNCEQALGGHERCGACPGCDTLASGALGKSPRPLNDPQSGEVLSIEGHPVTLPNGGKAVLLVEQVITEQKKMQASLLHQEKMAAFGMVAAGVAHEMGNPLSSIEMHLQLLDARSLSGAGADSVRTLRQETARLRRTLRELVDFARRRRDEATLVSVDAVVQDALRLIRYHRGMRRIEVEVASSPDVPPVHIVEDHLMQVIVNLLINALDAMPDGGTLRLDVRSVSGTVALRVRDSGTGMSHAVFARCFEPLYTTKAEGKGTGLGLSICRDVITAAGGNIEIHSSAGQGTTAVITLPAAASRPATFAPQSREAARA